MFWNQRQSQRSVPIDAHGSNVATFSLAGGFTKFHEYCQNTNVDADEYLGHPLTIDEVNVHSTKVSDDESDDGETRDSMTSHGGEDSSEDWPTDTPPVELAKFDLDGKAAAQDASRAPPHYHNR